MAWEHKPNSGSAFINRDKKEDWHAEYRGDIMLPDGTLHYLDVSPGTTKAGDVYYKVKIGAVKVAKVGGMSSHNEAKSNGYQPQPQVSNPDDDIPF